MPADICCINSHRSLSPTEPARPSPLTLNSLFAVAALPEDHPHSLKLPVPDRRPPKNLIRSPSFADKLKGQLRRRATVKSLKAEVYDEDARMMSSEEVLERVVAVGGAASVASGRMVMGMGSSPPTLRLRQA
jgi:hypothetical protein